MPTYEYECDACGHAFERIQRMVDPAVRKCPKCGKLKVRRLISGGAGVIFKGSGFYETDYKRKRPGAASDRNEGAADEGAGSAPSKEAAASKGDTSSKEAGPAKDGSPGGGTSKDRSKDTSPKSPPSKTSGAESGDSGSSGAKSRSDKKDSSKRP